MEICWTIDDCHCMAYCVTDFVRMLIMKYLRIHLIIWCLPCIAYTMFEISVFLAFNIISFIWEFKFVKWSSIFYAKYTWNGTPYVDRTPWDTFKRHYSVIL